MIVGDFLKNSSFTPRCKYRLDGQTTRRQPDDTMVESLSSQSNGHIPAEVSALVGENATRNCSPDLVLQNERKIMEM